MTKGEGLVALLYAFKDIIQTFAMMIIMAVGFLAFFLIIVHFIGNKFGWFKAKGGPFGGGTIEPKTIMYALFILFVMVSLYSLIALTASIFGVNSSPTGGILVK
jgi:hypothetical protein